MIFLPDKLGGERSNLKRVGKLTFDAFALLSHGSTQVTFTPLIVFNFLTKELSVLRLIALFRASVKRAIRLNSL